MISIPSMKRDFVGGIYLAPLGGTPPVDRIEPVDYPGDLRLPLGFGPGGDMHLLVKKDDVVERGALLASDAQGYHLYAPRGGVVGDIVEVWLAGKPDQPAVLLHPLPDAPEIAPPVESSDHNIKRLIDLTDDVRYSAQAVWQTIDRAGLLLPTTGEPLSRYLRDLDERKIEIVIANAAPLEPTLNTPLAMMHNQPERIFAGLSILKRWLDADRAILTYSHGFRIDLHNADPWRIQCVAIGEKYPQAGGSAVLKTLERMGLIKSRKVRAAVVFDCQTLSQVERAVLAGELPTTRIVTISGDGVRRPGHFIAPIGLPLMVLLERAGIYPDVRCVVEGSTLAGAALDPELSVVTPMSENYIVVRAVAQDQPQTCVRCGWCIHDCPARIDPARLYHLARSGQYMLGPGHRMNDCVECGICTYVCPSHLRILDHIRMMKHQWRQKVKHS
jgi:Na+-translocating ferredoxin:NAD+ oxidoreductase subunit C